MKNLLALLMLLTTAAWLRAGLIEQKIATAREQIAKTPGSAQAYNELAMMLVRRARETADLKYCDEADGAARESRKLDPKGFDGQKTEAVARLCQRRWEEARTLLAAVNKRVPDDVMVWGYLADADVALGNYEAAEKSVQVMLDLRQVNPQGLQRGAQLRELFGYNDPALEWWNSALRLTSSTDFEERAWILTRMAHVYRVLGKYEAAEASCKQALEGAPSYPGALEELGWSQMARKQYAAAGQTFAALTAAAPADTAALFELGRAQEADGKAAEAQANYAAFEKRARAAEGSPGNANLALAAYYAGPGKHAAEAQRIAKLTLTRQHNVETLQAYASALAAAGDFKGAAEQMALALKPGVKDPAWLLEAGRWAQKSGDEEMARKYFQRALEAAPGSPLAPEIIEALSHRSKSGG